MRSDLLISKAVRGICNVIIIFFPVFICFSVKIFPRTGNFLFRWYVTFPDGERINSNSGKNT